MQNTKYQRCTVYGLYYPGGRDVSIQDKYSEFVLITFLNLKIKLFLHEFKLKNVSDTRQMEVRRWQLITANFDLKSMLPSDRRKYFEVKMET